ncbi:chitinase [Aspergillus sclerotialis]|uniref:Chitinase n=1 Tax=Aspergillus sclerotialis TaxID=2070753 RepID=A0A3A2ZPN5_9EURO|nr:chitinase [Aspergillus sclerotialis]
MNDWDEDFYKEFNALKDRKPGLKTYISVGGWDAGGKVFSDMARFPGTRNAFIKSAIDLMVTYGFDGVDIDWEYPAAADRQGLAEDTKNMVTLMKELHEACQGNYGVTVTLPSSYCMRCTFPSSLEMMK